MLRIGYWVYRGTIRGGDWGGYSEACTVWATDPVGILSAHKGIFYAGFSFPFCQVLTLPGLTVDSWVMIQIVLSSVACVIVYLTGRLLMNRTAGVVAGFGLVVLWDTWRWTTLLYSTAMMTFAMACCLWAFARYHHSGSSRAKLLYSASDFCSFRIPWDHRSCLDGTCTTSNPNSLLPVDEYSNAGSFRR